MKKIFLSIAILFATSFGAFAQEAKLEYSGANDYSRFVLNFPDQIWQLSGVAHNDKYTGVFIDIKIVSNRAGAFAFPKNICISGDFGRLYPVALEVGDTRHKLGEWWYYGKGSKGKSAKCLLYFPRVPAGVTNINYGEPNFISWNNITIENPATTTLSDWTDGSLREYWNQNPCLPIEGIYTFVSATDKEWWGDNKHTFAVKKEGYQYLLIYLRGSNPKIWKEGEIKAAFVPTAQKGLYKVTSWYMENKMLNDNFYLKFSEVGMFAYEQSSDINAEFLKLYPSSDENFDREQRVVSANAFSASGVFVAQKVIATNQHVIDNTSRIEVVVKDGEHVSTYPAKVLISDNVNDLALLSIEDEKFNGIGDIPYALLSTTKDVGTSVFAMGYPMTQYMGEEVKTTTGIINSKTGFDGNIVTYQISAPIQPGSSGGPLFDNNGNLIGITNSGILAAQNVGYAIKSSYLCNLIESSPISITIPSSNELAKLELTEQIKKLKKYVVCIKVYK